MNGYSLNKLPKIALLQKPFSLALMVQRIFEMFTESNIPCSVTELTLLLLLFATGFGRADTPVDLGIPAIDSPCFRVEDEKEVVRQSNEAQALGYEGKNGATSISHSDYE